MFFDGQPYAGQTAAPMMPQQEPQFTFEPIEVSTPVSDQNTPFLPRP